MAYLGREGIIKFQRSALEPVVVPSSAVNTAGSYVSVDYDDWFLGEEVYLIHSSGNIQGFLHRDVLDRIYLHTTRDGALANTPGTRRSFSGVSLTRPIILAAGINSTQLATLAALQASLSAVAYERRLRGWPATAAAFRSQASASPWMLQGELQSWQLQRSAPEIDTGSLGETFATSIKSVVSGSGTLDFQINLYSRANTNDVDPLLRLVQLTEQGSMADAKFYLKQGSAPGTRTDSFGTSVMTTAALFFHASIILTVSSVSVAADDIVTGSADFVTTGPVRLLSEA